MAALREDVGEQRLGQWWVKGSLSRTDALMHPERGQSRGAAVPDSVQEIDESWERD